VSALVVIGTPGALGKIILLFPDLKELQCYFLHFLLPIRWIRLGKQV
jgi:hypothetical protein